MFCTPHPHTWSFKTSKVLKCEIFDRSDSRFLHHKVYVYFLDFFFFIRYSTLLHLPPLRFHCVGGCWDRTQDCCNFGIDSQTLCSNHSARSHVQNIKWKIRIYHSQNFFSSNPEEIFLQSIYWKIIHCFTIWTGAKIANLLLSNNIFSFLFQRSLQDAEKNIVNFILPWSLFVFYPNEPFQMIYSLFNLRTFKPRY